MAERPSGKGRAVGRGLLPMTQPIPEAWRRDLRLEGGMGEEVGHWGAGEGCLTV